MIQLLVGLIVLLLIIGILLWALRQIPLPEPLNWVVPVVIALILVLVLLGYFWPYVGRLPP